MASEYIYEPDLSKDTKVLARVYRSISQSAKTGGEPSSTVNRELIVLVKAFYRYALDLRTYQNPKVSKLKDMAYNTGSYLSNISGHYKKSDYQMALSGIQKVYVMLKAMRVENKKRKADYDKFAAQHKQQMADMVSRKSLVIKAAMKRGVPVKGENPDLSKIARGLKQMYSASKQKNEYGGIPEKQLGAIASQARRFIPIAKRLREDNPKPSLYRGRPSGSHMAGIMFADLAGYLEHVENWSSKNREDWHTNPNNAVTARRKVMEYLENAIQRLGAARQYLMKG